MAYSGFYVAFLILKKTLQLIVTSIFFNFSSAISCLNSDLKCFVIMLPLVNGDYNITSNSPVNGTNNTSAGNRPKSWYGLQSHIVIIINQY